MNFVYFRLLFTSIILLIFTFSLTACDNSSKTQKNADKVAPELITHAESGDLGKINELLSLGQNPDVQDSCQWTPLMKAAQYGHIDIVKVLLKNGAQVDQTDKGGYTALLLAASRNNNEIVELLIKHGANIDHQEKTMGWSALIWAAKLNFLATVKTLIQYKANPQLKDHQHNTALMWAQKIQSADIIKLLESATKTSP